MLNTSCECYGLYGKRKPRPYVLSPCLLVALSFMKSSLELSLHSVIEHDHCQTITSSIPFSHRMYPPFDRFLLSFFFLPSFLDSCMQACIHSCVQAAGPLLLVRVLELLEETAVCDGHICHQ